MANQSRDLLNADELLAEPLVPASRMKRFLNLLIDTVFFYIIIVALTFIIGLMVTVMGADANNSVSVLQLDQLIDHLLKVLFFVGFFGYYITFEAWLSKTPGKMITNTKVVDNEGQKPGFTTIFWRSLSRIVPFDAFTFLRENPIGIHDRISKTMVVNDKPRSSLDLSLRQLPE